MQDQVRGELPTNDNASSTVRVPESFQRQVDLPIMQTPNDSQNRTPKPGQDVSLRPRTETFAEKRETPDQLEIWKEALKCGIWHAEFAKEPSISLPRLREMGGLIASLGGLTLYWLRRLERNSEQLKEKPFVEQMARQITDLSAAGANLFHAVVELQRLRASSERKFQRWFFAEREEQERAKEMRAELERLLEAPRAERKKQLGLENHATEEASPTWRLALETSSKNQQS